MRVPFPTISDELAVNSHMYICIQEGREKQFIKCQTYKPLHMIANKPPFHFLKEMPNISRNPFKNVTTIDCDKAFCINDVIIDSELLAKKRKDVCDELYRDVTKKTDHLHFQHNTVSSSELISLNKLIKKSS